MIEKRGFLIVTAIVLAGLIFALIFLFNNELETMSGFSFAKINFYSWISFNKNIKPIFSYLLIAVFLSMIVLVFLTNKLFKLKGKIPEKENNKEKNNIRNEEKSNSVKKAYTELDELYEMIEEKKKVKMYEISRKFKISKEKSIEWCKILEEQGLIKINYPIFSDPEVGLVR